MNFGATGFLIISTVKGVLRIKPSRETEFLSGKLESKTTPVSRLIPSNGQYFTYEEALANARKHEESRGQAGGRGPWR